MRWVEITVNATGESAEAVSNILIEEGCGGTATSSLVKSDKQTANDIIGYLPVDDRLEGRLQNISERVKTLPDLGLSLASDEITIKRVKDEEWASAWKKFFKPLKIGRVVIRPTWEEYDPQPDDIVIDLDPGMAFGTGSHPTTKLCLEALQDYVKGGETVLDMGTGSAILAMAAARLGAARVVGLEIDPVAVEAAVDNVKRVNLGNTIKIERADSPSAFEGQADIVLANIIAKVIIDMAEGLASKVRPGGILIASGIVVERSQEVIDTLTSLGLKLHEVRQGGDWVALVFKQPD
ncbi:50S ribosomal protein L11 methyltransferase [bacterium]|nr:50S ribosomal protein L11 methyltransferase [bacterium]